MRRGAAFGVALPREPAAPPSPAIAPLYGSDPTNGCCSRRMERGNFDTRAFAESVAPLPHALVDISHRNCALEIAGPKAEDLLNTGCPLDLTPRAFPVGTCARTLLGKAEIVLWRIATDRFRLETWRSFGAMPGNILKKHGAASEAARQGSAPL